MFSVQTLAELEAAPLKGSPGRPYNLRNQTALPIAGKFTILVALPNHLVVWYAAQLMQRLLVATQERPPLFTIVHIQDIEMIDQHHGVPWLQTMFPLGYLFPALLALIVLQ